MIENESIYDEKKILDASYYQLLKLMFINVFKKYFALIRF